MKILGIETSCDETAAAVVEMGRDKIDILSTLVSSQVKIHAKYGGVVPEVAARLHIEKILPMIGLAMKAAKVDWKQIDAIAVTAGPGLISSLMIGVETAKTLAFSLKKPLIGVNHIEGHLLSFLATNYELATQPYALRSFGGQANLRIYKKGKKFFPAVGLIVSGGHTQIILAKDFLKYKLIGETRDDAAGEAFDKVAKILELGYPGGPAIARAAQNQMLRHRFWASRKGTLGIKLPRPMMDSGDFDMSFSGLKTAVLYAWRDLSVKLKQNEIESAKAEMAAEFQQAVVDVLVGNILKAAEKYKARTIILGGGVSANGGLRGQLRTRAEAVLPKVQLYFPEMAMTGDNAAMVAVAGYFHFRKKYFVSPFKLKADPNWELV